MELFFYVFFHENTSLVIQFSTVRNTNSKWEKDHRKTMDFMTDNFNFSLHVSV